MNQNEKLHDGQDMTVSQKEKLRGIFECRYERKLSDQELFEIHFNMKRFFSLLDKAESEVNL
jgi:hypothetical protein